MSTYIISQCTVSDGPALSRNNMSAFWQDTNWVLVWRDVTTLEEHIANQAKRYPRNLLNDRVTLRHQKALDPKTGLLVGYARWILPPSHVTIDGKPAWPEASIPEIGREEEAEIRRVAATVVLNPNKGADVLDEPVGVIKNKIRARKAFLQLDYLAVHPENQGKGIATALVESGMREAAKLGLDIFVLAFKAGRGLYKRLGFRIEEQLIQDDSLYGGSGEYGVYFMIYEQKRGADIE